MTRPWNMRAGGRKLALGLAVSGLFAALAQGGCAESIPTDFVLLPDAGPNGSGGSAFGTGGTDATGGSPGTGGNNGSGGSPGTGGAMGTGGVRGTGGVIGTGGGTSTGGVTGTGGTRATGGTTGSGGSTGTGGTPATGGTTGTGGTRATGGTTGSGGSTGAGGAAAATFTQIYQTILTVSCAGGSCHNPGTQGGVSFASQSSAYSAVKSRVVAGNATGSSFYTTVNGGRMPPGNKLSATLIAEIAAWINAGALNN
jgi:hypothetical protein